MTAIERATRLTRVDIVVALEPLRLTDDERRAVEAHWARATAANPALWNGSAFLFEAITIRNGGFSAVARPTDYATLLHRLRVGLPGRATSHVFPVPAVTSRDGRLLVGRQSATTTNAGLSYPPSGSFDADDVIDGRLDPIANMRRELDEEAGIDLGDLTPDPEWWALPSGEGRIALTRRFRSALDAAALGAAIAKRVTVGPDGELDRIDFLDPARPLAAATTVPYVPLLLELLAVGEPQEGSAP
ncbi:MAG: hypothetical protein LWW93_09135 [Hyphomicrobiales bacterium]|nr:hypothetical protein [Hyphomicrobiales bacterium]